MFEDIHLTTHIFRFLSLSQLCHCETISKSWQKVIQDKGNDNLLWKQHYWKLFSLSTTTIHSSSSSSSSFSSAGSGFSWRQRVLEINGLLRRPIGERVTIDHVIPETDQYTLLPRSGHGMARVPYNEDKDVVALINGTTFNYLPTRNIDMLYFSTPPSSSHIDDPNETHEAEGDEGISYIPTQHERVMSLNHQWEYCGWLDIAISIGSTVYLYGGTRSRNILAMHARMNRQGSLIWTSHELGIVDPTWVPHDDELLLLSRERESHQGMEQNEKKDKRKYHVMSSHPHIDGCSFTLDPCKDYRMTLCTQPPNQSNRSHISQARTSSIQREEQKGGTSYKYHRFLIFGGKYRRGEREEDREDDLFHQEDNDEEGDMRKSDMLYEARVFPDLQAVLWLQVTPIGDIPSPRHCHSVTLCHRSLYLFGGWLKESEVFGYGSQFSNEMFILDIDKLHWTRVIPLNSTVPTSDSTAETSLSPTPPAAAVPTIPAARCQANLMPISCRRKNPQTGRYHYHQNEDKDYLLLFGGACHNGDLVGEPTFVPYGTVVVDLCDFYLFDLKTNCWLSLNTTNSVSRGGCNATIEMWDGWYLAGGMHSNEGENIPLFHTNMARFNLDPL